MAKKKPAPPVKVVEETAADPTPTDAGAHVLHCADDMLRWHADQIAKAVDEGVDPATELISTQHLIEGLRDRFTQALAMLKDPGHSEETRRLEINEATEIAFMIGQTEGQMRQTLHGRADMSRAHAETHTERLREGRKGATRGAEARQLGAGDHPRRISGRSTGRRCTEIFSPCFPR